MDQHDALGAVIRHRQQRPGSPLATRDAVEREPRLPKTAALLQQPTWSASSRRRSVIRLVSMLAIEANDE
jgi:hypothetical protein